MRVEHRELEAHVVTETFLMTGPYQPVQAGVFVAGNEPADGINSLAYTQRLSNESLDAFPAGSPDVARRLWQQSPAASVVSLNSQTTQTQLELSPLRPGFLESPDQSGAGYSERAEQARAEATEAAEQAVMAAEAKATMVYPETPPEVPPAQPDPLASPPPSPPPAAKAPALCQVAPPPPPITSPTELPPAAKAPPELPNEQAKVAPPAPPKAPPQAYTDPKATPVAEAKAVPMEARQQGR